MVEITKSYHLQGHGTIGGGWEDLINGGDLYSTHSAGAGHAVLFCLECVLCTTRWTCFLELLGPFSHTGGVPGTPGVNPNLPFVSNQRVAFEAERSHHALFLLVFLSFPCTLSKAESHLFSFLGVVDGNLYIFPPEEEMETLASDSEEEAGADGGLIVNPGGMRAMYLGGKRKKEKRKKMRRARRERFVGFFFL